MRKIKLTQNKITLVSDRDYKHLNQFKWYPIKVGKNLYAARVRSKKEGLPKTILLHRYLMETPKGFDTDHIDGNTLNNQRKNLRICSRSENKMNVGKRVDNKSGYKGVSWDKVRNKWAAFIQVKGKGFNLGRFISKEEAYKAYCGACKKYHGEFSRIK